MSRNYEMNVQIILFNKFSLRKVITALSNEWFMFIREDDFVEHNGGYRLCYSEEGRLCGGESEEEFAERIACAIWDACECFVPVVISATYLDDLPSEHHELDMADYDTYLKRKEEKDVIN